MVSRGIWPLNARNHLLDGRANLGLSIVAAIVAAIAAAHDATLTVAVNPTGGLDIAVQLPAAPSGA